MPRLAPRVPMAACGRVRIYPHPRPHSCEGLCVIWGMPTAFSVANVALGEFMNSA